MFGADALLLDALKITVHSIVVMELDPKALFFLPPLKLPQPDTFTSPILHKPDSKHSYSGNGLIACRNASRKDVAISMNCSFVLHVCLNGNCRDIRWRISCGEVDAAKEGIIVIISKRELLSPISTESASVRIYLFIASFTDKTQAHSSRAGSEIPTE